MPTNSNMTWKKGELVSPRKFGIEIEMCQLDAAAFQNDMTKYNIPIVSGSPAGSTRTAPSGWVMKRDGSVSGQGLETISPPLSGTKGLEEAKLVLGLAKANNGATDRTCGLHVHHDAQDLTDQHLKNLLTLWFKYQDMLYLVCDPLRSQSTYCRKWTEPEVNELLAVRSGFKQRLMATERYHGLNFASLALHGTVEVRVLEGTTNVRKVEAWIALTQRLVRYAKHKPVIPGRVKPQFQLLGAVLNMLTRNAYVASEDEEQAFNLLSYYYHKNLRQAAPRRETATLGV